MEAFLLAGAGLGGLLIALGAGIDVLDAGTDTVGASLFSVSPFGATTFSFAPLASSTILIRPLAAEPLEEEPSFSIRLRTFVFVLRLTLSLPAWEGWSLPSDITGLS